VARRLEFATVAAAPENPEPPQREQAEDDDPTAAERRRQPELDRGTVEKKEPLDNEFSPDLAYDLEENAPRVGRMNEIMQGVARQASLDPRDDPGL
jgi:type IV secretion system protein VirD4